MIPYTSTAVLLAKHGNTPAGREAAREQIRAEIRVVADVEAGLAGRSLRCRAGDHSRMWTGPFQREYRVGCANDGTTCLCECHDGSYGMLSVDASYGP